VEKWGAALTHSEASRSGPPVRATRKEIPTTINFPTNLTGRSATDGGNDWERNHEDIEKHVSLPVEVESPLQFLVWRVVCCTVLAI
jgi:hypothetical protein